MSNEKEHKNFTACGDAEAEKLLSEVLENIRTELDGTGLCVVLGGSYGRGDGGVRLDRENGIFYNDLDFFAFAEKKVPGVRAMLDEIAEKYEKLLKVDVDFSPVMTVKDIRKNARRLMMQELKRGYYQVCGSDLLVKYLKEIPAGELPFSEACRLLVNRGMGLLFAGEKIVNKSGETDFILRNIYKAILGAGDAMLIAEGVYRWKIADRLALIEKSDLPDDWKEFYREAVDFKHSPHRKQKPDMLSFWHGVRDFFESAMVHCAGVKKHNDLRDGIYHRCCQSKEKSIINYVKYCVKSRSLPVFAAGYYFIPPVAVLAGDVYFALSGGLPDKIDEKLYQHWLIFN